MGIPNLPTDNLYKFLALSGIVIILFSFYISANLIELYNEKVFQNNRDIKLLSVEAKFMEKDQIALKKEFNDFDKYLTALESLLVNKEEISADSMRIIKEELQTRESEYKDGKLMHKKLSDIGREHVLKLTRIEALNDEIDNLDKKIFFARIFSFVGLLAGFIMSFKGFKNWYYKIQVYQDMEIKKKAENLKKNESSPLN